MGTTIDLFLMLPCIFFAFGALFLVIKRKMHQPSKFLLKNLQSIFKIFADFIQICCGDRDYGSCRRENSFFSTVIFF